MTVYLTDDALDASLNYVKNNATLMTVCSQAPTTRTEAVTTYALADVVIADTDFTLSDVAGVGRKATIAAKSGITVDTSGTMTHVALCSTSALLAVFSVLASQPLTAGNLLNLPAFDMLAKDAV